jgi:hypothetical protein
MLNKYNVDIYEISINDWGNMIYTNYCKNITENKFCFKKYKKDISGIDFCSKCCERKKIKRKNVYKKKNKKETINNDSAFYSDSDNTNKEIINNKYIKFGDMEFELDDKYSYLINKLQNLKSENNIVNNNHYINNNYIKLGELIINIDEKNRIKDNNPKNNLEKESKMLPSSCSDQHIEESYSNNNHNIFIPENNIKLLNNKLTDEREKKNVFPKKVHLNDAYIKYYKEINNIDINIEKETQHIYFENLPSDNDFYESDEEIYSEKMLNNTFVDIRYIEKYLEFIINEIDKLKYYKTDKIKWADNTFKSLEYFCFIPNKYKVYKNIYGDTYLNMDELEYSKEYLTPYIC